MGTEMHAHIEVLRNDVWYHFAAPILTGIKTGIFTSLYFLYFK